MRFIATILLWLPAFAFAGTATYSCVYTSYSDQEGSHKVQGKFELTFIVDRDSGKSYLLGSNGSSEVKLLESFGQVAFLEVTGSGNLLTTAIDRSMNSVHSRNSVIFGEIVPSQYYGKCQDR